MCTFLSLTTKTEASKKSSVIVKHFSEYLIIKVWILVFYCAKLFARGSHLFYERHSLKR